MYKRIFFGKIPLELAHVKDSNRYITVTMAALAALTLVIGVIPDLFLNPITTYINSMFAGNHNVLPIPHPGGAANNSSMTTIVPKQTSFTANGPTGDYGGSG
jgi:NADH-quinone oxidoreductase subunit M